MNMSIQNITDKFIKVCRTDHPEGCVRGGCNECL